MTNNKTHHFSQTIKKSLQYSIHNLLSNKVHSNYSTVVMVNHRIMNTIFYLTSKIMLNNLRNQSLWNLINLIGRKFFNNWGHFIWWVMIKSKAKPGDSSRVELGSLVRLKNLRVIAKHFLTKVDSIRLKKMIKTKMVMIG